MGTLLLAVLVTVSSLVVDSTGVSIFVCAEDHPLDFLQWSVPLVGRPPESILELAPAEQR